MATNIKLILIIFGLILLFCTGWLSCSWYRDSIELAEQRAVDKAIAAFEKRESMVAKEVNERLAELRAQERIRTIKVPEIIKQPEVSKCLYFRRWC